MEVSGRGFDMAERQWKNLRGASSKHAASHKFPAHWNFPDHQHWYWDEEDHEVGNDVEDTVPKVG